MHYILKYITTKTFKSIFFVFLIVIITMFLGSVFGFKMFAFPFEADIWGNVSDWTMVAVTALTFVYLVKTFKSQNKAIADQNKLQKRQIEQIDLELNKYIFDNLPVFELRVCSYVPTLSPIERAQTIFRSKFCINISFNIWHNSKIAKNITIHCETFGGDSWGNAKNPENKLAYNSLVAKEAIELAFFGEGFMGELHDAEGNIKDYFDSKLVFTISYEGEFPNPITQRIFCLMSSKNEPNIISETPKYLN